MTKNPEDRSVVRSRRTVILTVSGAIAVLVALSAPDRAVNAQQPGADVGTTIRSGGGASVRYAVADFTGTADVADVGRTIAQVLWSDLEFEREFHLVPRDTHTGVPAIRPEAPATFAPWRELDLDAVVQGSVERAGDRLRVTYRLLDVRGQRQVMSQQYEGAARNPRLLAHTIADAIHQQQANLRGVARTKLAFISDRNRDPLVGTVEKREVKEVYISDYDGANEQRITVGRTLNINPSWSPDAKAIAYTAYGPSGTDIVVSRIYEGILQRPAKGVGNNHLAAFSPDGTRIAFSSSRDGNGNYEIYVVNIDGSGLRQLTTNRADDVTPTWSPSGDQIAFTSDRTGRPQVYMMSASGGPATLISEGDAEADRPTWSPAPFNEIAYTARRGSWYDIKIYDIANLDGGSRVRWLTNNAVSGGSNESPAFSPTGRHLAFTSTRTGTKQIFTIGRDGRGERQITRTGNNQTPSWSSN